MSGRERMNVETNCLQCGEMFIRMARNDREPKFCSRKCLYDYRRENGFSEDSILKLSQNVSKSLIGNSRRWKGDNASYVAKHMWVYKHRGKARICEPHPEHNALRFEWANISGKYLRDVNDYIQLCPSCH